MWRVLVCGVAGLALAACSSDNSNHLPPSVVLDSTPPALTNQPHAEFAFHAAGDATGFACGVDGSGGECTSPFAIDLAEGAHVFAVVALGTGSAQGTPATFAWTIDLTPPDTTILTAPAAVDNSVPESITFTGSDAGSGSGALTFDCATDGSAFAACTSPASLSLADGSHTFAVRAHDAAGNVDPTPAMASWVLDTTTPDTQITAGPADGSTSAAAVAFAFTSPVVGATFECQVDSAAFAACTTPDALTLADGSHTFSVRAVDAHGVVDPSPASRTWTVDATAPTVTIDSHPTDPTNDNTPTFAFSSPDPTATFTCALDGSAAAPCASPLTEPAVTDGSHTFTVTATDPVGNTSSASFTWVTDTAAPTVTITSGPANPTSARTATFTFTASDGVLACSLDGAAPAACTSPTSFTSLADGMHTFTVTATDAAGNVGAAAATWIVDTAPPTVAFTQTPNNPSNSTSATFGFAASDGALSCQVDGGAFTACASPLALSGLSAGTHAFVVHATDAAGNVGAAAFTWVIDLSPPTVAITSHPTNPTNSTSATFGFTASDGTLACSVDGGAVAPCSSPATFSGFADGSHTFVVQATDAAGNVGTASFTWVVDTQPPTVAFTSTPPNPSNSASAAFAFSASDGTLACQLDTGAFVGCSSPRSLTGLADGSHTFTVRATDTAGNAGTASFTWVVDTAAPTVTITSHPANPTNVTTGTFAFTASDGALACKIDGGAFAACTSPASFPGLADGSHTFAVQATDAAGNVGSAAFTWVIDTAPPTVTITSHPTNPSNTTSATFAFTASDGTLACKLDGGAFAACSSPTTVTGLADGSHTFTVQATDTAGNTGSASFTWVVDTQAPTVTITSHPSSPTSATSGTFAFTASDGALACKLDGGAFAACTSPTTVTGLADGSHTFTVQATDTAGNVGSASFTWTVDTTAPTVAITNHPANPTNNPIATFAFTASDGTLACKVDSGAFAACSSPLTLASLPDGTHTFTVQATDTAGNVGSASFTWSIVTVGPTVTFTQTPSDPSNSTSATFAFTASGGTLTCQVDTGAFAACSSPKTITGLANGAHTFTVHATDAVGNVGAATFTWTVDTIPPVVTITSHPTNPTNNTSAAFAFTTTEGNEQCQLDTGAFAACAGTFSFSGLPDGSHTFTVKATDAAGNVGSASFTWVVDTAPPTVTITSHPTNPSNSATAAFAFTASDGTLACKLDAGAFAACSSPTSFTALADGSHTFVVQSTDTAGNIGSASFTWTIDTQPPTVTITSHPANPTNATTASFAFTASDGALTCQLDTGAFAACTSPQTFTGLAAGTHTFTVHATDTAGNVGSAAFTWVIDLTPPTVTITSHPTNPSNSATGTFAFTASDGTLACKLDSGAVAACSSPTTFTSLADGSHTFTVQSTDTAGNVGSASFTWVVDTQAPTVSFSQTPSNPSNSTSATFAFAASDGTLTCQLDAGGFAACSSPKTVTGLADGSHTFTVHATDTAGNVGTVSFTWTVDTAPPTVTITSHPTNPSNSGNAAFAFTASDGTEQCQIDGGALVACTGTFSFSALADGSHTFRVQSTDAAGNVGAASFTWTIDTVPPTVTITSHPTNPSNSASATFAFTASDGTLACKLDSGAVAACSSPTTLTGLADGSHTFTVQSTDTAGNVGSTSFTWVVDTTAPTVTITSHPVNPTNATSATFAFTASDGALTCQLDTGTFATCTSPQTFTGLAAGTHTFTVHATDTAGNVGSAAFTWVIDLTPPTVTITSHPTNPSNSSGAVFAFTASDGTEQCQIDAGALAACTGAFSFTALADGSHTFRVQSTDTAGNVGSASFTWVIDTVAPTVTFTQTPANPTNATSATFAFTVSDGTVTCSLDGAAFSTCASPQTSSGLVDGSHSFVVHATDTAGNVGSASFTWTVDTTPPVLVLDDAPPAQWPVNYYDVLFHSPESGVTFTCSVSGGAFTTCASPFTITTGYGSESITIKAADALGNTSSASATWTATAGLVLHYPWEQGATHNTSLLKQRPTYSPDGTVTLTPVGGWAGTAVISPPAHTYPKTIRALTSSATGNYTASFWVIGSDSSARGGTVFSTESATGGLSVAVNGITVTVTVRQGGQPFTATTSIAANRWSNVAIRTTTNKGVEVWVNGASRTIVTPTPATQLGFGTDQASDLTVGALTTMAIDDLRFYNVSLSAAQMCTTVALGTFDANGGCVPNIPAYDYAFDGNFLNTGTGATSMAQPQTTFSFIASTLGAALQLTQSMTAGAFTMTGVKAVAAAMPEHTLTFWFDSGATLPSDTLLDFTATCSPLAVGNCGISAKYVSPNQLVIFGGTAPGASNSTTITLATSGHHGVAITEQRGLTAAGAPDTTQLTIFVDGVGTVLKLGTADVFANMSDTLLLPHTSGAVLDEYQFFPRDLSADPEMLCENGFDGEFDVVTGGCTLTSN